MLSLHNPLFKNIPLVGSTGDPVEEDVDIPSHQEESDPGPGMAGLVDTVGVVVRVALVAFMDLMDLMALADFMVLVALMGLVDLMDLVALMALVALMPHGHEGPGSHHHHRIISASS